MSEASYKVIITALANPPADLAGFDIWIHAGLPLKGVIPAGLTGLTTWGEKMRATAWAQHAAGYPGLGRLALGQEETAPDLRLCIKGVTEDPAAWFAIFCRPGPERLDLLLAEVAAA